MAFSGDSQNFVLGGVTLDIGGDMGYTKEGVTVTPTIDLYTVDGLDQLVTPPKAWVTGRNFEVAFTLVEPKLESIGTLWDIEEAVAALVLSIHSDTATAFHAGEYVVTVTGYVPGGSEFVRTILLHKCVVSTPAPFKVSGSEETNLAATMRALYDDVTENEVGNITDAAA